MCLVIHNYLQFVQHLRGLGFPAQLEVHADDYAIIKRKFTGMAAIKNDDGGECLEVYPPSPVFIRVSAEPVERFIEE